MRTYAIADLHGRYDLLVNALDTIEEHADEPGQVVFLGDYVDRGRDSNRVLEHLIAGPRYGWDWYCIKGNHEDMMVQACSTPARHIHRWWFGNGGNKTLKSYRRSGQRKNCVKVVPHNHLNWLKSLPTTFLTNQQIFVHAGLNHMLPLHKQSEEELMWKLYEHDDDPRHSGPFFGRHVVHGHHQFQDGPKLSAHRTNLDTFAWATGRLVVGVFDNTQGPPIDLIEVIGPADDEHLASISQTISS